MYISLIIIVICLVSINWGGGTSKLSEKRNITELLKFILSLLVVNNHIFMLSEIPSIISTFRGRVSIFLLLTGYGLMYSYNKKGKAYIADFIKRRGSGIIIPFISAYIVSLLSYQIFKGSIDWMEVITTLYWGGPYLQFSWYITELIILYSIFYVTMKFCDKKGHGIHMMTLAVIMLMALMFITKQPVWYIESLPAFLIGIWFYKYEDKVINLKLPIFAKYAIVVLLAAIFLITYNWQYISAGSISLSAYRYQYSIYYIVNIAFTISVLFALIHIKKFKFDSSKFEITRCYYEIYLMQNCAMIIVKSLDLSFPMYWLGVMLLTLILAYVMHKVNKAIVDSVLHRTKIN